MQNQDIVLLMLHIKLKMEEIFQNYYSFSGALMKYQLN